MGRLREQWLVMTEGLASAIFDVLAEHAGAHEEWREPFIKHFIEKERFEGIKEYYLSDPGMKCFFDRNRAVPVFMDCYSDARTPKRIATIARTNKKLAELLVVWAAKTRDRALRRRRKSHRQRVRRGH